MKFFSLFAVAGFALTAVASPVAVKRQDADVVSAFQIFSSLYENVKIYTAQINNTCQSITPLSTLEERAAAAKSVQASIRSIIGEVDDTTPQIQSLADGGAEKRALAVRQAPADLAGLVANIILEISGALNNIVNALGLGAILGSLGLAPLIASLSALLIALRNFLDQVLELVQRLVYQLLTGLATGIIGIFP